MRYAWSEEAWNKSKGGGFGDWLGAGQTGPEKR